MPSDKGQSCIYDLGENKDRIKLELRKYNTMTLRK